MEDKFYNIVLRFLSYRSRSEKEIREKLRTKNAESRIIEKIIEKLKKYKFIDDEDFAKKWVENRNKFKPRSLRLIKLELKQKGVSEEIIENLHLESGNDLESAKKLVEKRMGRLKSLSKQEIYQKLGRFLASKGFNWDIIKKAIDEILDKGV